MIWTWLLHVLGLDNLSGPYYGFWSGVGSDIGELSIILAALAVLRRHNCHVKGCWRIGHRTVEGTSFVVCTKHHPEQAPTHEHIKDRHRAHKETTRVGT